MAVQNEDNKPWYASVTIISSLIVVLVTLGKLFGKDLSVLSDIEDELIVLIFAGAAIYGRFRATKSIGQAPAPSNENIAVVDKVAPPARKRAPRVKK